MGRRSTFKAATYRAVLCDISRGTTVQAACDRAGLARTTWVGWNQKLLAVKAAHAKRTESPPVPTPRSTKVEQPEIVGTCTWTWRANSAAAVLLANALGAAVDCMRDELRRKGAR